MVARLWSAHAKPDLLGSYLQHFSSEVQPGLRELQGFLGVSVCTRPLPGAVEILVTTYWDSFAAIEAFAGADRETAVVAEAAAALLTNFDRRVKHYEVALAAFPSKA